MRWMKIEEIHLIKFGISTGLSKSAKVLEKKEGFYNFFVGCNWFVLT